MRQQSESKCSAEMKQNSRQKNLKGFTLAEVLITLVIIGVIAAITIPMITANARRQETSARLKKFYSAISQASIRSKADGNDWQIWADSGNGTSEFGDTMVTAENFSKEYLLPYINYMKTEKKYGHRLYIYLNDGSYFWVDKGGCIDFLIDVNGEKKPNEFGRDIFEFIYCSNDMRNMYPEGVSPHIRKDLKLREQALEYCKTYNRSCSGLVAIDGWEFKDDYPYKI